MHTELKLRELHRFGDGPVLGGQDEVVTQYEVLNMPPEQQAWVLLRNDYRWKVLREKSGIQGQSTGTYNSAEDALAAIQRGISGHD